MRARVRWGADDDVPWWMSCILAVTTGGCEVVVVDPLAPRSQVAVSGPELFWMTFQPALVESKTPAAWPGHPLQPLLLPTTSPLSTVPLAPKVVPTQRPIKAIMGFCCGGFELSPSALSFSSHFPPKIDYNNQQNYYYIGS